MVPLGGLVPNQFLFWHFNIYQSNVILPGVPTFRKTKFPIYFYLKCIFTLNQVANSIFLVFTFETRRLRLSLINGLWSKATALTSCSSSSSYVPLSPVSSALMLFTVWFSVSFIPNTFGWKNSCCIILIVFRKPFTKNTGVRVGGDTAEVICPGFHSCFCPEIQSNREEKKAQIK